MLQNFQKTNLPTLGTAYQASGSGVSWQNPSRITADDASSSTLTFAVGGDFGAGIRGSFFGFPFLPDEAVIDGILLTIDGTNSGCYGDISLNVAGTTTKPIGALTGSYGSATDLWGADSISPADTDAITVSIVAGDVSGGDGVASIDYISLTIFWHIDVNTAPADVPTRVAYKVFSREGRYLGELPDVTSKLGFPQDINSAGSSIEINCGKFVENEVTVDPLLTEAGDIITTEDSLSILATSTNMVVALGAADEEAIFKNSNRIKVWLYNYWHPSGKLMFSGQVNRVSFQYGAGAAYVRLLVYSDGLDMDNYIARGYPFSYTDDVTVSGAGGEQTISRQGVGEAGWNSWGQTYRTGAAVTNEGALSFRLNGTANVTCIFYTGPNGTELGRTTKSVNTAGWETIRLEFPALIDVSPNTEYFFALWVDAGQTIQIGTSVSDVYANGSMYNSNYAGGAGGSFLIASNDLWFITASGAPTTTTTYTGDDPVTEMFAGILTDYNNRGGLITERDFVAAGLLLTYTFNSASIFDALRKCIEMSPTGYYSYVDLGTAEIDISPTPATADFTIVRGKDINQLTISLSIEQVKNYLLLSGGEVSPGVNLFRDYPDNESIANYGIRTTAKSDNRVILTPTADAIGETFTEENADERQETTVTVLNEMIDITLLTPGKTIGFKNFGSFIDDMVLQIARREFQPAAVTLTLGRLPVTMSAELQRMNRELLFEQTINNPTAPS